MEVALAEVLHMIMVVVEVDLLIHLYLQILVVQIVHPMLHPELELLDIFQVVLKVVQHHLEM